MSKIIGAEFSDVMINALNKYLKAKGFTKSEFLRSLVRKELEREKLLPINTNEVVDKEY